MPGNETIKGIPTGIVHGGRKSRWHSPCRSLVSQARIPYSNRSVACSPRFEVATGGSCIPAETSTVPLQLTSSASHDVQYFPINGSQSPCGKLHAIFAFGRYLRPVSQSPWAPQRGIISHYRRRFEASGHSFVERLSMGRITFRRPQSTSQIENYCASFKIRGLMVICGW